MQEKKKKKKKCVVQTCPALISTEEPRNDTFSQLFGDFVCIDVLASFADVNLKGYEKISTHPSTPAYLGGHFKAWVFSHFFVCFIALCAHVKYRQELRAKVCTEGTYSLPQKNTVVQKYLSVWPSVFLCFRIYVQLVVAITVFLGEDPYLQAIIGASHDHMPPLPGCPSP